ncbi:MAG: WYL domain-containing protein [Lachnospiraceae bacterium]|nr:WYL domain-containing protein [Lachnospiraceae bacterium]
MENEYIYPDKDELDGLVLKAKAGDDEAWSMLLEACKGFIHYLAWGRIKGMNLKRPEEIERELFQAGWVGFASALKRYVPGGKAGFLTYARKDIEGAISDQLKFEFDNGIADKPKGLTVVVEHASGNTEMEQRTFEAKMTGPAMAEKATIGMTIPEPTNHESFGQARSVLQILKVLKMLTDEDHSLSKAELLKQLHYFRLGTYGTDCTLKEEKGEKILKTDDGTYTKELDEMLAELDPLLHTGDNDDDYLIRYSGYEEDRLYKKINKTKGQKSGPITDFSYNHLFDKETLDRIIALISLSDMFSEEEKIRLIKKLVGTASVHYDTPFMDGNDLKFNPKAIHGRFSGRNGADRELVVNNLRTIQFAINNLVQIRFRFNHYTADHKLIPKQDFAHALSPYHLVVFHDNYYVIGLNQEWGDNRVLHYRVDLMSDIEIARDEAGEMIPIKVCDFTGLPISNVDWDPGKYMAEHLNMAFDEPRDIKIKIPDTEYTLIHTWFGSHFRKVDSITETDEAGNETGYDIIVVRTSPFMIVSWAMQYGTTVEILDEEIREKIRERLEELRVLYE